MQVTNDADRVARSVALPVCAYLLLVHLYGRDEACTKSWSLFQLKQRFTADTLQEQVHRNREKVATKVAAIQAGSMIDELSPVTYEFVIGRVDASHMNVDHHLAGPGAGSGASP